MRKIICTVLTAVFLLTFFSACSPKDPTDEEVSKLAQSAIDAILVYTNNTPAEIIRQEFPGIKVFYEEDKLPEGLDFITNLDYSDFSAKYGQIFDDATLEEFVYFFGAEQDGKLALTDWYLEKTVEVSDINVEFVSKDENEFTYKLTFVETKTHDGSTYDKEFEIKIIQTGSGPRLSGTEVVDYFFFNAYSEISLF